MLDVIEIEPGLRIKFPGRSDDFCLGVEVGILAGELASAPMSLTRSIAVANVLQVRELASKFGYRVTIDSETAGIALISLTLFRQKPRLQVVR